MQSALALKNDSIATVSEEQVKRFLDILALTIPFAAPKICDMTVLAWHPILQVYTWTELNWYLTFAAEHLKSFPPLSEIRKILSERRNGFLTVDPFLALKEGVQNKNAVTEPVNSLAQKFGGWTIIGMWQMSEWEFKRKSINEAWESVKRNYRVEQTTPHKIASEEKQHKDIFFPRSEEEILQLRKQIQAIRESLFKKSINNK